MARYGFHGDMPETKILVLYALCHVNTPVSMGHLAEIVMVDEGVDYFYYCQALSEMCDTAHVLTNEQDGQTHYSISPRGYEVSGLMENQLSASLKMAVRQAAQMFTNRVEQDSFINTEAFTRGGLPMVCCELTDGTDPILHIELMIAEQAQGATIAKNFRAKSEKIYNEVLKILLDDSL